MTYIPPIQNRMNFANRSLKLLAVGFLLLPLPKVATSQTQPQAINTVQDWKKINAASSRIKALHVTWKRDMVFPAQPQVNVEKQVARATANAQQNGESAENIKQIEQTVREFAQEDRDGHSNSSVLDFWRVGPTIKCDVYTPSPVDPERDQAIDFFDGKNAVYLPVKVAGKDSNRAGILTRDPMEILSHSAFNWLLPKFLLGVPFEDQTSLLNPAFSKADVIVHNKEGNIVLEREAAIDPELPPDSAPNIHQVIFSAQDGHPIEYNFITSSRNNIGSVHVEDYQKTPEGILFPTKVVVSTPVFTSTYTLTKSAFNQEVDPTSLLLPSNIRLSDDRFGLDDSITYRVRDGKVPSDDNVRQMLGKEKQKADSSAKAEQEAENQKNTVSPVSFMGMPLLGAILTLCGGVLWFRSKSEEKQQK